MNLTKLALKRPVSCFLVILALAVFGISSIFGFKMELTPDIEMPMLIVMATYPGADPESVDELVASVIEDSGSTLSGVDSVNSYSFENYLWSCSPMNMVWILMNATMICVPPWRLQS